MSSPGILGSLAQQPTGGILGNGQMQPWQSSLGLLASALKDAGAQLGGRPEDANSVLQYQQLMRQNQLRQAYATAASTNDPQAAQQASAMILANGGDPTAIQHYRANQAMPQLLALMQPKQTLNDNPVGVTPAVNATGPDVAARRQAAFATNAAPVTSMIPGMSLADALPKLDNPYLSQELGPQLIQSQNDIANREKVYKDENAVDQLPKTDPAYAGWPQGTILGRNKLTGAVQVLNKSDMMSPGAMAQKKELLQAQTDEAIAKSKAMYGLGGDGTAPDFSKPLSNPAYEAVAKSVANYDRSEATALSRYPAPIRAQIQARVSAINPDYTQTDYNAANATKLAFSKGPQAQSIQSLNSTISHMDLMKQYVTALNNGDVQTINALKNAIATEFGGVAPTNAQAVAEILGPEMAKAVLPNGGTGPEREGFVNTLKQKASQGQLIGTLDTYQGLMAGQLLSLKKRYMAIPGHPKDFEAKFLLPETQHILASRPEYQGGVVEGPFKQAAPANPAQLPQKPPTGGRVIKYDAKGNRLP